MDQLLYRYRRFKINQIARILDRLILRTRQRHDIQVIVVTGTIGKTSAKVAISQLLATRATLYIDDKNRNSDRAVRLAFFGLETPPHSRRWRSWVPTLWQAYQRTTDYPYKIVVLELAESRYSTLEKLAQLLKPEIGLITGVSPAHMSYFKTYDRVVRAVWRLVKPAHQVLYNADFADLADDSRAQAGQGFGVQTGFVHFTHIRRNRAGTLDARLWVGKRSVNVTTYMVAEQSLNAVAAAVAVADASGWKLADIAQAVSTLKPVQGRMNPLRAESGALLLDDTFNASPQTVTAALDTLASFSGRKIAVLGSMNELGSGSVAAHQAVGRRAAEVADELIVVGAVAQRDLIPAAKRAGMPTDKIHGFSRSNQVGLCLKSIVAGTDTVLFKGSQGDIYMEEAIKYLLPASVKTEETLVRQVGSWRRRKQGFFADLEGAKL